MRCLALADAIRRDGAECHFATTSESFATVPGLLKSGYRCVELEHQTDVRSLRSAVPAGCDWLVVDHYGWGSELEASCRPWARNILVIDDLANRAHDCDILLDQTFGRTPDAYRDLVPTGCNLLVGSQYALLRSEFAAWRPRSLARRGTATLRRVLVSMGLSDPANVTPTILEGLLQSKLPLAVDVVLGPSAPGLSGVKSMVEQHNETFTLHVGTSAVAELLSECDLCFGAAGSSAWERCCLGVPAILAIVAENQRETAECLATAGAALSLGYAEAISPTAVANAILSFLCDRHTGAELSARTALICDGRGAGRVAMRLMPVRSTGGKPVWLRPAVPADVETTYAWQAQPETRRFSRNRAIPTRAEHEKWFSNRLLNSASIMSIIVLEGVDVGTLRLDRFDRTSYEVSIVVSSRYCGQGVGFCALDLARRLVPEACLKAEIMPGNERSEALFTRAGYLPAGFGWRSIEPLSSHSS
jgi:UDP-2,4-diacetamido-2,4,6-trideoxy-beta-L-altropyranose hydrolase